MPDIPHDRGPGRIKRILGIAVLAFTALLLVGVVQDVDLAGILIVGFGALGGGLLYLAGMADAKLARQASLAQLQLQVLELAKEDGTLTATEVATRLGWTLQRAGMVLDSLEDGYRVCSVPSSEGVMVFEFRELLHDPDLERQALPDPQPMPARQAGRSLPG
jgi:hypothetical protein